MTLRAPFPIRNDEADPSVEQMRLDRGTLRPSRQLDDGSWVYDAYTAYADRVMHYAWGREVATEEALSAPMYLDSLRGLAVVARHPESEEVDITKPGTYREVGTILGARWDSAERAVALELVVRNVEANRLIRELGQTGLSHGYRPSRMDIASDPARQLGRIPNHIALTLGKPPRMPGAHLRVDEDDEQESPMKLPFVLAALAAAGFRTDSEDSLTASLKERSNAESEAKTRADAAEAKVEAFEAVLGEGADPAKAVAKMVSEQVADISALRSRADALDIEIPDSVATAAAIRVHMAKELGADAKRCDSDSSFCDGVIAIGHRSTAATRMVAGATRRQDSQETDGFVF